MKKEIIIGGGFSFKDEMVVGCGNRMVAGCKDGMVVGCEDGMVVGCEDGMVVGCEDGMASGGKRVFICNKNKHFNASIDL